MIKRLFFLSEDERWDSVAVNSRRRTVSAGANLTETFAPAVPYTIDSFKEVCSFKSVWKYFKNLKITYKASQS